MCQLCDARSYCFGHRFLVGQSSMGKDKKYMHLPACGHGGMQQVLVHAPGFHHLAAYPVAVYRMPEFLFGYGKAHLYRCRGAVGAIPEQVNHPYRENRKRFSCTEKRINMLLFLEPLIYLESITNGKKDLRLLQTAFVRYSQFMTSFLAT